MKPKKKRKKINEVIVHRILKILFSWKLIFREKKWLKLIWKERIGGNTNSCTLMYIYVQYNVLCVYWKERGKWKKKLYIVYTLCIFIYKEEYSPFPYFLLGRKQIYSKKEVAWGWRTLTRSCLRTCLSSTFLFGYARLNLFPKPTLNVYD